MNRTLHEALYRTEKTEEDGSDDMFPLSISISEAIDYKSRIEICDTLRIGFGGKLLFLFFFSSYLFSFCRHSFVSFVAASRKYRLSFPAHDTTRSTEIFAISKSRLLAKDDALSNAFIVNARGAFLLLLFLLTPAITRMGLR